MKDERDQTGRKATKDRPRVKASASRGKLASMKVEWVTGPFGMAAGQ